MDDSKRRVGSPQIEKGNLRGEHVWEVHRILNNELIIDIKKILQDEGIDEEMKPLLLLLGISHFDFIFYAGNVGQDLVTKIHDTKKILIKNLGEGVALPLIQKIEAQVAEIMGVTTGGSRNLPSAKAAAVDPNSLTEEDKGTMWASIEKDIVSLFDKLPDDLKLFDTKSALFNYAKIHYEVKIGGSVEIKQLTAAEMKITIPLGNTLGEEFMRKIRTTVYQCVEKKMGKVR